MIVKQQVKTASSAALVTSHVSVNAAETKLNVWAVCATSRDFSDGFWFRKYAFLFIFLECPCPANNSILLLSTYNGRNKPMVISPTGDLNDDLDFEYDGAEAHNGCSATLMGEFWYFGGGTGSTDANQHKRQVN